MIRHALFRNAAAAAAILAGAHGAATALVAEDKPNVSFEFETIETLPDGSENRLSAPRVTTRPGTEAMIAVSDAKDYFEFTVKPDWKDGKIRIEGGCEIGRFPGKDGLQPRPEAVKPRAARDRPAPRPAKVTDDRTPPQKPRPQLVRLFPDNLRMQAFAKLPGKPPRIVLRDLTRGDDFWIPLGRTLRDIRFVSVDYARSDPRALLEHKGQFAEVTLSSPILTPTRIPVRIADKKFSFIDLVTPGESLVFDLGLSKNGHPQHLRLTAKASGGNSN